MTQSLEAEPQYKIWKRYINLRSAGMVESYLILYNGWLTMINVSSDETHTKEAFLTNDFLESYK